MGFDLLDIVLAFLGVMLLLSIVITAIVQILTSILNLRGWVLVHGVKQILEQLAPGLRKGTALTVAGLVLQHPTVTHQFFRRNAVAIRADELVRLLDQLLAQPERLRRLRHRAAIEDLQRRLGGGAPPVDRNEPGATDAPVAMPALQARVDAWFATVMDRTSVLYASWTQLLTVLVAFVLVGAWQIDALHIYDTLRSDKDVRQHWLSHSQRLADGAARSLDSTDARQAGAIVTAALLEARRHLAKVRPAALVEGDLARLAAPPARIDTRDRAEAWIVEVVSEPNRQQVLDAFGAAYADLTVASIRELRAAIATAHSALASERLGILPAQSRMVDWRIGPYTIPLPDPLAVTGRQLAGMVLAWFLLSLGAPFWFNLLKTVSNLRPTLANKVEPQAAISDIPAADRRTH